MARKQIIVFVLGIGLIFLSLVLVATLAGRGYTAEALFFQDPKMQESLDIQIREAKGPLFIRRMFLNKPIYILTKLGENYLKAYSPEYLFLYTEPHAIYSIWSRGRVYFLDLFFVALGIAYLYTLHKKAAMFVVILVLVAGLPGMIGGFPYSARNFFLAAMLPILTAGGVVGIVQAAILRRFRILVIAIIALAYVYVFGGYLFDYYNRYAHYGAEPWFKSLRDVSSTLMDKKDRYENLVVGTAAFSDLLQVAFYTKVDPKEVQKAWSTRRKNANEFFDLSGMTFTTECLTIDEWPLPFKSSILYITHESCNKNATASAKIRDFAGNTVWKIYEIDKLPTLPSKKR